MYFLIEKFLLPSQCCLAINFSCNYITENLPSRPCTPEARRPMRAGCGAGAAAQVSADVLVLLYAWLH